MRRFSAKKSKKKLPGKTRRETRHINQEAYDKAKLKRSGLWNPEAAKKRSVIVTKIIRADAPSATQTAYRETTMPTKFNSAGTE